MNYIEIIDKLADFIESHPFLTLHESKSSVGIAEPEIQAIQDEFQVILSNQVKDFYRQVNGFTLRWSVRSDMPGSVIAKSVNSIFKNTLYPKEDSIEYPDASINILKLREVFTIDWKEQMFPNKLEIYDFRGTIESSGSISKRLNIFDDCGLFMGASFINNLNDVILISDHYTDWNSSKMVSFEEYLAFIFSYCGLLEARMDWLIRSDLTDKVQFDPSIHFEFIEN
jgi:hypothetical protein